MITCPKCGEWLKFHMSYFCGEPYIEYFCKCGYHYPSNMKTYTTTSTELPVWGTVLDYKTGE